MNVYSLLFLLLCTLFSCQLRIDNTQENAVTALDTTIAINPPAIVDTIPALQRVESGYYTMLASGNAPPAISGAYSGSAVYSRTNIPILSDRGIAGRIKAEISLLHSQGLIRILKIYAAEYDLKAPVYPLLPYAEFEQRLPPDSVAATYYIASGSEYVCRRGEMQIVSNNDQTVTGRLEGMFFSERGDSLLIKVNFKAAKQ